MAVQVTSAPQMSVPVAAAPPVSGKPTPAPVAPPAPVTTPAPVKPPAGGLADLLGASDSGMSEFLVVLDDQSIDKVNKAFDMPVGPKRRSFVVNALRDTMMKTQQPLWDVIDGLTNSGHVSSYQPLWIENAIVVNGDETAMTVLSSAAGVADAVKSEMHLAHGPQVETVGEFTDSTVPASSKPSKEPFANDPQWNLSRLNVAKAHQQGLDGTGTTLASIDTGVDLTHPALLTNFRGYDATTGEVDLTGSWFDSTGDSPDKMVDGAGHGTHTTGTAVGSDGRTNRIGVAPGATWFAARGLGDAGGSDGMLLKSFQYVIAPKVPVVGSSPGFKRDLGLGADVINNSWGSNDGLSTSYLAALRNMAAMGVINVFAAGNDGKGGNAGSVGSPATSPYIVSVAATDKTDQPAEFSSRGPNPLPHDVKDPSPFVAAPGVDIRSSIPDGRYESGWQGTSMAAPAISGLALLTEQAAQQVTGHKIDVNFFKDVLRSISKDVGIKGVDNDTGYGIPDAGKILSAVKDVAKARGLLKKPEAK